MTTLVGQLKVIVRLASVENVVCEGCWADPRMVRVEEESRGHTERSLTAGVQSREEMVVGVE